MPPDSFEESGNPFDAFGIPETHFDDSKGILRITFGIPPVTQESHQDPLRVRSGNPSASL